MQLKPAFLKIFLVPQSTLVVLKRLCLAVLFCCLAKAGIYAQTWERFLDFSSHDFSKSILQTADGGVLVTGNIGNGNNESNGIIIKLNSDGEQEWDMVYGGSSYDEIEQLIPTSDGGYLMAGYTFSFGDGGDVYLIKINDCQIEWENNYGGSGLDRARTIVETSDGHFVFAGWTNSLASGDISQGPFGQPELNDGWIGKVDQTGVLLWELRIGGSEDDEIQKITAGPDGGVVFVTNTTSPELGANGFDIYGSALDGDGIELWNQIYGGTEYEEVFSIISTIDGGYAIGAITSSFGNGESDIYLIKTNSGGQEEWFRTFGGSSGEFGGHVSQKSNGEYVVVGATQSFGSSFLDVYMIRTDGFGIELWSQNYSGGPNVDISTFGPPE